MKCVQYAAHNPKFEKKWDYSTTPPPSGTIKFTYKKMNLKISSSNCDYLADTIFKLIFLNENIYISIYISLIFVPEDAIDNKWGNGLALNR